MQRTLTILGVFCLLMTLSAAQAFCLDVSIAPKTLVLGKDTCVTVHAAIDLDLVDRQSVLLGGVAPYLVKADDRGDLVAKFDQAAIETIVSLGRNTLTLTGDTLDGEAFSGSDTIVVKKARGKR